MRIQAARLLVGALLCLQLLFCQAEQGAITGTVTDSSGALVPGADVTLAELNTHLKRTIKTNASGSYVFP